MFNDNRKNSYQYGIWSGSLWSLAFIFVLGIISLILIAPFSQATSPSSTNLSETSKNTAHYYTGYIEGDYRFIAAPSSGWLEVIPHRVGEHLSAKELAFVIEDELQQLDVDKAQAQVNTAKGQLMDLKSGKRDEVIAKLNAQRDVLQTKLTQAIIDAKRNKKLVAQKSISLIEAQHSQIKVDELKKQIDVIDADIALARLSARDGALMSGQSQLALAQARLAQAKIAQARRKVYSRIEGEISAIYRHTGEWVQAGQVVIKLLPTNARKVVFYVSEEEISHWKINDKVMVSADGASPRMATIREIDDRASFTPPVIYSEDTRTKLVFRVVAYFDNDEESLPVGLPVSVYDV
ncbi:MULTISPECIES: HlyD family secretion protein [Pasteurellaceae]|uniref:HlyD family efflux transporter periplasmic adaptor subunit n=1 Tax=Pasteurella atlantica TaxID=2827233 RepID=A0AAW8CEZ5_9PAST|nr:HlyD family efflux transporter periplasmic adaptor subunit [Pasteurella atlantica]MBR0573663.1 HlyD family efflux transporter periplasmic adaptor subunit [Pasteurella atlantica]MDP8039418.1 HlyD family efflux transporter periplasmic adaptor subunit [Pasteurella atlantica]MDP8041510.1 HlyD family efflux transporter periplasmic adaptor subunit [Pasteurella atlantica]MDP8043565.1 HlyD family efflux transporter periplasmic adaptor subunit [Pasteurella atlantica]MDP8045731.1 HlyD family efflux t